MKTKEEDLVDWYKQWCKDNKKNGGILIGRSIRELLSDFATKEDKKSAIDFMKFTKGSLDAVYVSVDVDQWQALRPSLDPIKQEIITTDELYELYLQSKTK